MLRSTLRDKKKTRHTLKRVIEYMKDNIRCILTAKQSKTLISAVIYRDLQFTYVVLQPGENTRLNESMPIWDNKAENLPLR